MRILTKVEAEMHRLASKSGGISLEVNDHLKAVMFTSCHGLAGLPSEFVPVTEYRKDRTVDELLEFYLGFTLLESLEELASRLDTYYPEFGHVKDSGEPNWQPEHFPEGTVVELKGYYVSALDNELHSGEIEGHDNRKPAVYTVQAVVSNGIDSHCIISTSFTAKCGGMFESFNFSHVGKIIKRGEGKVEWKESTLNPWFEKQRIRKEPLKKGHYYWTDIHSLMPHILSLIPSAAHKRIHIDRSEQINKQSFVKTLYFFDMFSVRHASKKKLREYVRKNWTRWLMTTAEIKKMQRDYDYEMQRQYFEDMERDFDSDLQSREVMTRGINDYGNNQEYLDGVPVCGNCKCNYINRGGDAPLGMGTNCMSCQNEDPVDYHDGDGCFPVTSIGMPSQEQTQSDVANLSNKGNANGY
jgi:hypothetical protein